jgi:hypothetical protein
MTRRTRTWPADREQRARIIGNWLQTEGSFGLKNDQRHAGFRIRPDRGRRRLLGATAYRRAADV